MKYYGANVHTLVSQDATDFIKTHFPPVKIFNYDETIENNLDHLKLTEYDLILNCSDNENEMYKYIDIVDSLSEDGWYITLNTTFLKRCDEHYTKAMKGHVQTVLNIDRDHDQFIKWFKKKGRNARWALFNDKYATFELDKLKAIVEDGGIKPIIRGTYDLSNGKQAFQDLMNSSGRGKLVITIDDKC